MDLWRSPYEGREIECVGTQINGQYRQVVVDRNTREPITDRFGRIVSGVTTEGCFRVYALDGLEVVSGYVQKGDMRVNMYTGEAFKAGVRVRRPDKGPLAGIPLRIPSDKASNRRHPHGG